MLGLYHFLAKQKRDAAEERRRVARVVSLDDIKAQLIREARKLDAEADALERQAANCEKKAAD